MKLAILSDLHANLEALTACLAHAQRQGAEGYVFLGDLVGYGADPRACLEIVVRHAEQGALVVRGNHDEAALGGLQEDMSPEAREAILWTRTQLGEAERRFLASLPYIIERDGCCFVHASAQTPAAWRYITGLRAAAESLAATAATFTFVGHLHVPTLYYRSGAGMAQYAPVAGIDVPLAASRRWLAVLGAVGQPRDGNPAAAYALFDPAKRLLCFHRVPYDWFRAAAKIRRAGLPEVLVRRLELGL